VVGDELPWVREEVDAAKGEGEEELSSSAETQADGSSARVTELVELAGEGAEFNSKLLFLTLGDASGVGGKVVMARET